MYIMIYSHCDSKGIPLQKKLSDIINKESGFFKSINDEFELKKFNL